MTKCESDEMLLQRRDAIFRKLTLEGNKILDQAIICLIKNQTDFKAKKKFLRAQYPNDSFTVAKVNLLLGVVMYLTLDCYGRKARRYIW
jgi:hypothetical protein